MKPMHILAFVLMGMTGGTALGAYGTGGGFSHDNTAELFGYYMPKREIRTGNFRLETFSIGTVEDLKKYESGRERLATYAPVMFTFQDLASKKLKNEMGDTYYANEPRVLPTAYRIQGSTITFAGADKQIGTVVFRGTIDIKALDAVKADGTLDTGKTIVTGDLIIAGHAYNGVRFRWFGGD